MTNLLRFLVAIVIVIGVAILTIIIANIVPAWLLVIAILIGVVLQIKNFKDETTK